MNEIGISKAAHAVPVIHTRDEHNISRQNIDPDALKIMYRLIRNGYKAFLVGGGVRDLLLKKTPKDFDIGTDATPRKIKYLFRNSRIIGRRFKLVHVYFRGRKIIEVSTFRDLSAINEVEEETDDVQESTSKQEKVQTQSIRDDNVYGDESTDALRRDLTINGLFYDLSNFSVIDYVGGMQDLRSGTVRIIGNPDERLHEDPVRLLRVVRHAARNDFKIEKECWESMLRNQTLILKSPAMRVYEEVKKDLTSGHIADIFVLLAKSGLLSQLIPQIAENQDKFLQKDSLFFQTMQRVDQRLQSGGEVSSTVVLTLIVLMTRVDPNSSNAEELFFAADNIDGDEISDWIKNVFVALSVPRKERERIEMLLAALRTLVQSDPAKLKRSTLFKRPFFKDLQCIGEILQDYLLPAHASEFLQNTTQSKHVIDEDGPQERRRNHHRRRRNRHPAPL